MGIILNCPNGFASSMQVSVTLYPSRGTACQVHMKALHVAIPVNRVPQSVRLGAIATAGSRIKGQVIMVLEQI